VRLLNRTTRHHSLTEAGALYYEQVRAVVRELDSIRIRRLLSGVSEGHPARPLRTSAAKRIHPSAGPPPQPPSRIAPRYYLSDHPVDLVETASTWRLLGVLQIEPDRTKAQPEPPHRVRQSPLYFDVHGEPASSDGAHSA